MNVIHRIAAHLGRKSQWPSYTPALQTEARAVATLAEEEPECQKNVEARIEQDPFLVLILAALAKAETGRAVLCELRYIPETGDEPNP